jgi:hypothetical protein
MRASPGRVEVGVRVDLHTDAGHDVTGGSTEPEIRVVGGTT